jgi:hypothetical protein
MIDPNLKSPPPEVPSKKAKECAEEAEELLECLCLPVDEVKSVHIKRITLDIDVKDCYD